MTKLFLFLLVILVSATAILQRYDYHHHKSGLWRYDRLGIEKPCIAARLRGRAPTSLMCPTKDFNPLRLILGRKTDIIDELQERLDAIEGRMQESR